MKPPSDGWTSLDWVEPCCSGKADCYRVEGYGGAQCITRDMLERAGTEVECRAGVDMLGMIAGSGDSLADVPNMGTSVMLYAELSATKTKQRESGGKSDRGKRFAYFLNRLPDDMAEVRELQRIQREAGKPKTPSPDAVLAVWDASSDKSMPESRPSQAWIYEKIKALSL